MQTCSVAPASDFAWGRLLPSSPWSCRNLPFVSWPVAILVQRHTDDAIIGYSPHVRAVCDVILKTGPRFQDIKGGRTSSVGGQRCQGVYLRN